mgnify:CR=1 FL=1
MFALRTPTRRHPRTPVAVKRVYHVRAVLMLRRVRRVAPTLMNVPPARTTVPPMPPVATAPVVLIAIVTQAILAMV